MSRGLYRMAVGGLDIARVSWGWIDGRPFIVRTQYEAERREPPFDELPCHRDYDRLDLRSFS